MVHCATRGCHCGHLRGLAKQQQQQQQQQQRPARRTAKEKEVKCDGSCVVSNGGIDQRPTSGSGSSSSSSSSGYWRLQELCSYINSSTFLILKILNIEERTTVRTANTSEMGVLRHALHHISVNEPPQLFTIQSIVFLDYYRVFTETLIVMTTLSAMAYTEKLQWPGGLGALLLCQQHSPRTRCERVAKG